jgi:hypothetical protein
VPGRSAHALVSMASLMGASEMRTLFSAAASYEEMQACEANPEPGSTLGL